MGRAVDGALALYVQARQSRMPSAHRPHDFAERDRAPVIPEADARVSSSRCARIIAGVEFAMTDKPSNEDENAARPFSWLDLPDSLR